MSGENRVLYKLTEFERARVKQLTREFKSIERRQDLNAFDALDVETRSDVDCLDDFTSGGSMRMGFLYLASVTPKGAMIKFVALERGEEMAGTQERLATKPSSYLTLHQGQFHYNEKYLGLAASSPYGSAQMQSVAQRALRIMQSGDTRLHTGVLRQR